MPGLLIQFSDTHIRRPGELAYRQVNTSALFAQAVAAVLRLPQAASAVVITGDLTDFGRPEEYAQLQALLAPLPCPIYLLPGNHDDRAELRRAFGQHDYLLQSAGTDVQYVVELDGLRLIAIDTTVAKAPHGELDGARLSWLEETLSQERLTPTIIAMHHPPFSTFIGHMDDIGLKAGRGELAGIVARHPQVERIICGHLHRSIQARFGRTVALTAPSTAHAVAFDIAADAASEFVMEPPGFMVHAWSAPWQLTSHVLFTGVFNGPYPFHDESGLIE